MAARPLTTEEKAPGLQAHSASRVWSDCVNDLWAINREVALLYGDAAGLLLAASVANDARAGIAAMVMSRATIESAAYTNLTLKRSIKGIWQARPFRDKKGRVRRVLQLEFKEQLCRSKKLSPTLLGAWDRIEDDGNWIAHTTEYRTRIRDEGKLTEARMKALLFQPGSISDERALEDIRDAAKILIALAADSAK